MKCLQHNTTLQTLNIHRNLTLNLLQHKPYGFNNLGNSLGNKGVQVISEGLLYTSSLQKLNFECEP
jgi:hypothetical protein